MKENILVIIHKLTGGGAERVISDLSTSLCDKFNVIVLTLNKNEIAYPTKAEVLCLENEFGALKLFSTIKKIKRIKQKYNIKYSISALTFPNFLNALTRVNDKLILTIHNNLKYKKHSLLVKLIHKFSCKMADKIVCVSYGIMKSQIEDFNISKNKVTTIYNICNVDNVLEKSREEIDAI